MADTLYERVKQHAYDSSRQEAMIHLLVTAGHYQRLLNALCESYGITYDQYNILRILREVHPQGYPRYEISRRMIERMPDVTRLLDRLARRNMVERVRSGEDKRLSIARITTKGIDVLDEMDPKLKKLAKQFTGHISKKEMKQLSALCARIYEPHLDGSGMK